MTRKLGRFAYLNPLLIVEIYKVDPPVGYIAGPLIILENNVAKELPAPKRSIRHDLQTLELLQKSL
jgi:hypothetical protein